MHKEWRLSCPLSVTILTGVPIPFSVLFTANSSAGQVSWAQLCLG